MRRLALPGAVLLALLTVFLVGLVTQPGPARVAAQGSQSAAVSSITRSCPPLAAGTAAGRITMIALPPRATGGTSAVARAAAAAPAGDATLRAVVAAPAASGGYGERHGLSDGHGLCDGHGFCDAGTASAPASRPRRRAPARRRRNRPSPHSAS